MLGNGLHGIDYEVGVLPGAHIMFAKSTHRGGVIPPLLALSRFILRRLPTHGVHPYYMCGYIYVWRVYVKGGGYGGGGWGV